MCGGGCEGGCGCGGGGWVHACVRYEFGMCVCVHVCIDTCAAVLSVCVGIRMSL